MSPRPPRRAPIGWSLIGLLTVASMAVARGELAEARDGDGRANRQLANVWVSGIVDTPWWLGSRPIPDRPWSPWPPWAFRATDLMERGVEVAQVGLLVLGVGLCRRANRPVAAPGVISPRRLRPGPGRIAAIIATATMSLVTLGILRGLWFDSPVPTPFGPRSQLYWPGVRAYTASILPEAIAGAWVYLFVTGQYRRRPADPVERLGRWLGWAWIATGAAARLVEVVGMTARSPF